jgi:uncharacterized repeat protein (TIGR03833 family)
VAKNKVIVVPGEGGELKHNPFSQLASLPVKLAAPSNPMPSAPAVKPQPVRAIPGNKVRLRLETTGRSGKAVTRIEGIPTEHLELIASKLRKALGCGATVEGGDLLLIGSLVERARQWFDKVEDLRAIANDVRKVSTTPIASGRSSEDDSSVVSSHRSHMKRADIRRGQRVAIVTKVDQPTGNLTFGIVRDLLTNAEVHPRGIKVRLETGEIGRVQIIYE